VAGFNQSSFLLQSDSSYLLEEKNLTLAFYNKLFLEKSIRYFENNADSDKEAYEMQNSLLHRMRLDSPLKELVPSVYSRQNTITKTIRDFSVQNRDSPLINFAESSQKDNTKFPRAVKEATSKGLIDFTMTERSINEFGDGYRNLSSEQIDRIKQQLNEPNFPQESSHHAADH